MPLLSKIGQARHFQPAPGGNKNPPRSVAPLPAGAGGWAETARKFAPADVNSSRPISPKAQIVRRRQNLCFIVRLEMWDVERMGSARPARPG